jgi:hypothetical protein
MTSSLKLRLASSLKLRLASSLKLRLASSLKLRLIKGGIGKKNFYLILKSIKILLLPPLSNRSFSEERAGEGFFPDSAQTAPTPQQP